jgi:SagB-type dehydrogenase family enzyme
MMWRDYHEATKHTVEKLAASRHYLDWDTMPDPFRHYEGVPVLDLPSDAPPPDADALDILSGGLGRPNASGSAQLLSQLLFHSAAISATKVIPSMDYSYALRVNPSSGNLHPTEFHFATRRLPDWPDGLYHYRPSSHAAEQRAIGDYTLGHGTLVFFLTSIAWREAWKYRERAYRYCLLDIGHAAESLVLAARASGYHSHFTAGFDDGQLTRMLGVEDEWPMLIVALEGVPREHRAAPPRRFLGGIPNQLSKEQIDYPLINRIHTATKAPATSDPSFPPPAIALRSAARFAPVVRNRRSALDFRGGAESIPAGELQCLLACSTYDLITLYAYVHRVRDMEPGVYCNGNLLMPGDQRVSAAALSLSQNLAGNSCVTFSMVADLERAAALYGDRGYRYAFFEAGMIGQRLYIVSEALGFNATGIGAFYDDAVHQYLGLAPAQGQVIYHFACGYAVKDNRISAQ